MWGTITNQLNNRIMAKKVYVLYRTDNWHTYTSRELLVVAGSIRRCCKVAKYEYSDGVIELTREDNYSGEQFEIDDDQEYWRKAEESGNTALQHID